MGLRIFDKSLGTFFTSTLHFNLTYITLIWRRNYKKCIIIKCKILCFNTEISDFSTAYQNTKLELFEYHTSFNFLITKNFIRLNL